jgi:hypothetical protein
MNSYVGVVWAVISTISVFLDNIVEGNLLRATGLAINQGEISFGGIWNERGESVKRLFTDLEIPGVQAGYLNQLTGFNRICFFVWYVYRGWNCYVNKGYSIFS